MLSVIIPAYNEELSIEKAYFTISNILKSEDIENEIIFIDDGSSDNTYEKIKTLADKEEDIIGLHFSRNFGKEAAISAGLASATGDCVVVIDCDLQHPPEKIVEMYRLWQDGFEIVESIKISAYTTAPMQIVTVLGFIMLFITAVFSVWAFIDKIQGRALEGMTTVILILIFIGSIMMISLGIIGYYVARIYEEIKGRPKYIISSSCKGKKNN